MVEQLGRLGVMIQIRRTEVAGKMATHVILFPDWSLVKITEMLENE